tara:strand:- start:605 stop:769 length:165 start_codon:yes stop_codon:yes gene_type:complete
MDSIAHNTQKVESFKVETPFVTIESDSGNHATDMISVMAAILVLFIFKKIYFNS